MRKKQVQSTNYIVWFKETSYAFTYLEESLKLKKTIVCKLSQEIITCSAYRIKK